MVRVHMDIQHTSGTVRKLRYIIMKRTDYILSHIRLDQNQTRAAEVWDYWLVWVWIDLGHKLHRMLVVCRLKDLHCDGQGGKG